MAVPVTGDAFVPVRQSIQVTALPISPTKEQTVNAPLYRVFPARTVMNCHSGRPVPIEMQCPHHLPGISPGKGAVPGQDSSADLSGTGRGDVPEANIPMACISENSKKFCAIRQNIYALCTIYCACDPMKELIRLHNRIPVVAGIAAGTGIGRIARKSREIMENTHDPV